MHYQVEKWSDTVHAKRNLLNHLYKLKSDKSFPANESKLSNKVIEYLGKCFSYCITQNAGNSQALQEGIKLIVPHAFGDHGNCKQLWCGYKKDSNYKHKDLPFGKDLVGDNLRKSLEEVFEIYSSETVVKKLLQNASSQRNESLNSTIGSENPKTRFYGGSESADHRVACAVAQTNLGKQYLSKVLETVHITPGCTMTKQIQKMDYERKQDKIRKQSKEFKKRRKQLRNNRSKKDGQRKFREGTVYQSGEALKIDDEILNACNVTANELCNLEQLVSPFCLRRKRTYLFLSKC